LQGKGVIAVAETAINIGATSHLPAIRAQLHQEFGYLQQEGIMVEIMEEPRGNLVFLNCKLKQGKKAIFSLSEGKRLFANFVANALAEIIISQWEKVLLADIIKQHYSYFTQEEQEKILEAAQRNLNSEGKGGIHLLHRVHRKSKVLFKLIDYLETNTEIVLDGFIRFRLKDYLEELQDVVDRAVDDFMLEREYKEFIRLLRYFVDIQEPKQKDIHVLLAAEGTFKLMDTNGEAMTTEELADLVLDISGTDINYEDLLISALISLAPERVYLHRCNMNMQQEVIETIKKVFEERLVFCPGCKLCTEQGVDAQHPNPDGVNTR
jgi:putative sporulation protein YtxC